MASRGTPSLGPLERRVLEILWDRSPASVADVHRALGQANSAYAYTTVLTILSRLHEKGVVRRERQGRAYVYTPALPRAEFLTALSRDLLAGLTRDYGVEALAHFGDAVGRLPRTQRRRLLNRLTHELSD